jgi:bacterioferritin
MHPTGGRLNFESENMRTMATTNSTTITKKQLIDLLNEDLQREFQAVIAYVNYSQVLKGAAYMNIADELAVHAKEELKHSLKLSYWIDLLGGMPAVTAKPVKTSEKNDDMLRFDLENEKETAAASSRRTPSTSSRSAKISAKSSAMSRITSTPSPPPSAKTPPTPASPPNNPVRPTKQLLIAQASTRAIEV